MKRASIKVERGLVRVHCDTNTGVHYGPVPILVVNKEFDVQLTWLNVIEPILRVVFVQVCMGGRKWFCRRNRLKHSNCYYAGYKCKAKSVIIDLCGVLFISVMIAYIACCQFITQHCYHYDNH